MTLINDCLMNPTLINDCLMNPTLINDCLMIILKNMALIIDFVNDYIIDFLFFFSFPRLFKVLINFY